MLCYVIDFEFEQNIYICIWCINHANLKLLYSNVQLYILQTTVQKFGVSKIFLFKDINTFILQGPIKLIKNDNDFYIVAKNSISNECCSFELSIHQRILGKNVSWFQQKY